MIRLATTINAYEEVAFTSKSTNMGTCCLREARRHPGGPGRGHGRALRRRARELLVHRGCSTRSRSKNARPGARGRFRPRGLPGEADATGASRGERGIFRTIRRRRRLRRRRGRQGRDAQPRSSRPRRGSRCSREGGERPGRSVRQQVPEGFYPSPKDVGVWFGRVVLEARLVEKYCRCTFAPTTPWRGSSRSPRRRRMRTCCSITRTPGT